MGKTYSITDLAREFDVTSRAIRFYEEQGLLSPARKGQARVYSPGDRIRLKLILRGKRLGFTLDESRELFELYDPASGNQKQLLTMLETIQAHKNNLSQQMHDIQIMQLELDEAEQRCRQALSESQKDKHHRIQSGV
ncbi:MerR family DNA-binding transcriptional regulator [Sansalvadorimonas sp. 2012CJ34-2]|uniref:MerR family DNA-binding transcriptional regulator n=1 Tax=Parendozoicomonas callyspongiae TaxID=2942213 RepID=A0ABT0PF60_9GAMM|nr:MerR family DNA-binding transcriptional regulator [Sansalvadorimonas sp. 2012CJ34-2]MCL6269901.1 MerR family DNA-binding transcriptional regulator [Sansalvadorimonas sp. 2012CJ34-2]